ncbi:bacillithiol system redox-active protein YtxJ [Sporosarcina gallistercoris]|uniref:Bacillithiol system redox-active protein YtxJ n=1 Tax=Sporosarcina gallistercoris TaxID=2762245 RepID=A0ABR8PHD9_9BACL|nr:bacillithiol system redox-active protein YtxJ [Sporosarcina gallistercoris]MBD7907589.1 bacillithiol system redox-active protein YtxJ [Sporosarcina gallistercoris]
MQEIHTIDDWNRVVEQSDNDPVLVIKHSTTCPISAAGYREFQSFDTEIPKYCVIVQTSKDVSQKIAEDTGVRHESPQALFMKNAEVVWHAAHYDIQQSALKKAVNTN